MDKINSSPKGLMQVSYEVITATDYLGNLEALDDYILSSMNPAEEKQKVEFVLHESGDLDILIEHFPNEIGINIPHQYLPDDTPPIKKTEVFGGVNSMYDFDGELLGRENFDNLDMSDLVSEIKEMKKKSSKDEISKAINKFHSYLFRDNLMEFVDEIRNKNNPILFAKAAINANKAIQWKKGRDWFDNSETVWNGLTRTSRREEQVYYQQVWIPCVRSQGKQLELERIDVVNDRDYSCGEWGYEQRLRSVMVNYPSDGFVPTYSQDMPSLPASNRYYINGANHIEVLNMSKSKINGSPNDATKTEFDRVFSLRDDIFFTPIR